MIKCPNCGKKNSDDNKFCGECGTDLSEAERYCPNCDKMHNDGEKFCTQCGTKLMTIREYQEFRYKKDLKERFCRLDGESLGILSKEFKITDFDSFVEFLAVNACTGEYLLELISIKKAKAEKEKEKQRIEELIEIGKSTSTLYGPSTSPISRAEEKKYFRDLYR